MENRHLDLRPLDRFDLGSAWQALILCVARPLWQLAILIFYAISSPLRWTTGALSVGAAVFVASSILISSRIDHHHWHRIQVGTLYVEAIVAVLLSLTTMYLNPLGPGSLLLLPSLVAFGLIQRSGQTGVWVGLLNILLYLVCIRSRLSSVSLSSAEPISVVLVSLYGVVMLIVFAMTWLVRGQLTERHEFSRLVRQSQEQSEQLSRINEQVSAYANRVYDLAAADERNRIAGEIHDTVAHRLTALIVQLQSGRRMIEAGDTAAATDNLSISEELARESLDEVRRSVRSIQRKSSNEGIAALRRLTLHYASLTGMTIEFEAASDLDDLPAQLMAALYRVIQEGLTNAQRHGRASKVEIRLRRAGPLLNLTMQDNGRGTAQPALGFGLSSMRQRLRQYGGDIEVASQPGMGFCLSLKLPLWEEGVR